MVVLDGNFALGCGPGMDYPSIHIFQCLLERTDDITKEVLERITFVLAYLHCILWGEVELLYLHLFLTLALEGDEWSASRPGRVKPVKERRYPLERRVRGSQS